MVGVSRVSFRGCAVAIVWVAGALLTGMPHAEWVQFADETATRISADPGKAVLDTQQKAYAWGDVDQDGDIDLVVVRKQPRVTAGKFPNYLFINQDGVLTERTDEFVTASDVDGDEGFATPTNDRDVVIADVDNDGWPDIVTAVTISDGDPKHIGHPRVYVNLGCAEPCEGTSDWLGFRYEDARIPTLLTYDGASGFNPRFNAVAAGDVTGDGFVDLYFVDHDDAQTGAPQPAGADFNDRLLVNLGPANPGFFVDTTHPPGGAFSGQVPIPGWPGQPFPVSGFGSAACIADINGDGANDIVKLTALDDPRYLGVAYNDPASQGSFDTYDVLPPGSTHFASSADLDNDDRIDLVLTDDGIDRYLVNQGNSSGVADFEQHLVSYLNTDGEDASGDDGFGGDSVVADLDRDGWNDVLITDVDPSLPGCSRRMHVYRNLTGNGLVDLQEQTTGPGCWPASSNPPSCLVVGIPSDRLTGVHDVAVFDVNRDGWPDMVLGRCAGTSVYIQQPTAPPAGAVPDGAQTPGPQLEISKPPGSGIKLHWSDSCAAGDTDYVVYEGLLAGDFTHHGAIHCTTLGSTHQRVQPRAGDTYYLVVPHNGAAEGSPGADSSGTPRIHGVPDCYGQAFEGCAP